MKSVYSCSKKECFWNEANLNRNRDELSLSAFYKSKPKSKPLQTRCNDLKETLCQKHYFSKRFAKEICKQCNEEHDYEELIPLPLKRYDEKRKQIIQCESLTEKELIYLKAYYYVEEQGSQKPQYQEVKRLIDNAQKKAIIPVAQKMVMQNRNIFTLNDAYHIQNIPSVELSKPDNSIKQENQLETLLISGGDRYAFQNQGINLLMRRYPQQTQTS